MAPKERVKAKAKEEKEEKPDKKFHLEGTAKLGRKVEKESEDFDLDSVTWLNPDLFKRMGNRVLRMFIVGLYWEMQESQKSAPKKSAVKTKKTDDDVPDKPKDYTGTGMMAAFVFLVFLMRFGEESFTFVAERADEGINHYEVLSIATTSDDVELRQAYKKLALKWHPDKNKNCSQCLEKFNEIAASYEVLHDPEKRIAYDEGRTETVANVARASTTLTRNNFAQVVTASNDIWVIQIHDSGGASGSFHPIWEDLSQKHQRIIKFGRVDMEKDKECLDVLPVKSGYPPTMFMHAPKIGYTVMVPRFSTSRASMEIPRYIFDSVPRFVQVLSSKKDVRNFFQNTERTVRVLLVGHLLKKQGFGLEARTVAYKWSEFASFAFAPAHLFKDLVSPDTLGKWEKDGMKLPAADETGGLVIATRGGLASLKTPETVVKDIHSMSTGIADDLEEIIGGFVDEVVPVVSQTSLDLLCKTRFQRRYCLVLVDQAAAQKQRVSTELAESRRNYLADLAELKANEEIEDVEEEFFVQAVHAASLPGSVRPVDWSYFPALDPQKSLGVLVEIETGRYAQLPLGKSLNELYQNIAYEDLRLDDVPEGWSLQSALANPMESITMQMRYTFVSPLRILGTLAVLSFSVALLPEFKWDLRRGAGLFAAVAALFLGVIPAARRDAVRWVLAVIKLSAT